MDLEKARKKERYTKGQVAHLLGVTAPTYARMERDPESIKLKYIPKLCELFKINVLDFF